MLKRTFDVSVAVFFLIVFSPLFLLIAALIKLDSRGPVFHRASRAGRGGAPFTMYKFRTMVVDAARFGPGLTRKGDPRVTRVGRWLRKFKIDEVPQLINVLKGEMSMVGPRPEDPRYVAYYTPAQRQVLGVRPGMASPAAVRYRHEEEVLAVGGDLEDVYLTAVLPNKLWMDVEYIMLRSFWGDILVLLQVAIALFSRSAPRGLHPPLVVRPAAGDGIGSETIGIGNGFGAGSSNGTDRLVARSSSEERRR
ncbi:MAG: sugar transferase [Chloroflexi bacterium]|nr:sugar transferase [Chloroflexota bacterium]